MVNQKRALSIQENDGHVKIYCDHKSCIWSWPLPSGAAMAEVRGRAVESAVIHALNKQHDE